MNRALLLGALLLVPGAALVVAAYAGSLQALRWQDLLGEAGALLGANAPTLADLCANDPGLAAGRLCRGETLVGQSRLLAGAALAVAAALPLAMAAWALAARIARPLLRLVRPLAFLWLLWLLAAVALDVAAAASAVVTLETVVWRHQPPVGATVVGLLGGTLLLVLLGASFAVLRRRPVFLLGVAVEPDAHPQLAALVDEVTRRLGAWTPAHLVLGLDPGVHASALPRLLYPAEQVLEGPQLYLSLPLMRLLDVAELGALVAHELSHWNGDEHGFSRGTQVGLATLAPTPRTRGVGWRAVARWPAATLTGLHVDLARGAAARHERLREWRADQDAVALTSAPTLARALVKLAAADVEWRAQDADLLQALAERRSANNLSRVFQLRVAEHGEREWLLALARSTAPHPVDRNLPLQERIELAGVRLGEVSVMALGTAAEPAITLVADHERIEESLSDAQQQLYRARDYGIAPRATAS